MKTILQVTSENEVLTDKVKQLGIELEETKRQIGGSPGDILMHSVVDSLLHQAKSLSTLILEQDRHNGSRYVGCVTKNIE